MAADSKSFSLTPQSSEVNTRFAAELLATIRMREEEIEKKHPILLPCTYRLPISQHRELKKASKKHKVSMTAIVVEGLRRIIPALLSEAELEAVMREVMEIERENA